jgi:diacylglycerol O-acyltransferase / wax synthase
MPTTERMASADAAWLHMDRPTNLMVVSCVFWFDTPLDADALAATFAERLVPAFPRFAQRAVEPPVTAGLVTPQWEDVDGFVPRDHVLETRLPSPGSDEQLHAYVSEQSVVPLDRSQPLWQAHLVQGYGDGCAVLLRTHHAIADGTALVQALLTLVDAPDDPDGGAHSGQLPLAPRDGSPGLRVQAERNADRARRLSGRLFDGWTSAFTRPVETARRAVDRGAMLTRLGFGGADDDSVLRGPLSGRKQMTWTTATSLADVKRLGKAHGATVNDVALAAVAGGLRRYLRSHGDAVDQLTAVVPVNLRPLDSPLDTGQGNEFGLVFVRLPVSEPDAAARLAAVKASMDQVKVTGEGVVVYGALNALGRTPVQVEQAWLDLFGARATAVVTNIAGPREAVQLTGVPVRGFTAWVPSTGPIGVGLSICTYVGDLLLGVAVDEALVPDSEVLLTALADELADLLALPAP